MNKCLLQDFLSILLLLCWQSTAFSASESELDMTISGRIDTHCDMNFTHGNVMDFSNEQSHSLPFKIDCNRPLNILVSSENSGLKLQETGQKIVADYQINIGIPGLKIDRQIDSSDLENMMQITSSGDIPFETEGVLDVTIQQRFVYAGRYDDVLTIDVVPVIDAGL